MPKTFPQGICVLFFLFVAIATHAALIGGNFEISGPGCQFPDVSYGTTSRKYLVVWADYNVTRVFGRLVTDQGAVSGEPFPISEAPYGGLFPAVAYNATDNEFLVTWDDFGGRGDVIRGQRVRAFDGALLGSNFTIGSVSGGIRSAVAWSAADNVYLVVYFVPGSAAEIYGQRVSGSGILMGPNFNISNDTVFSGYPAVSWGSAGDQFLVTWDNNDGNIYGRRVDASTGALLGATIFVTSGGGKDRSCSAYDSINSRWLVQYNDGANAGFSYDQYGQLITLSGALSGAPIPLAHTTGFEGDTQFGGDVAFVPIAQRFFSSFGTDTGMGGQESSASGAPVGAQVTLGTGYFTSLNNAADPGHNRFLTAWHGLVGTYRIFGQLYGTTINPVANFTAAGQNSQNALSWQTPNDVHFTGTLVRYKTSGYPAGPDDGVLLIDLARAAGSNNTFTHSNLTNWTTYYYAAFSHDIGPNYSLVALAAATPRLATVEINKSDFASGSDGWTLSAWQSGPFSPGPILWDSVAGNIVSAGAGASNNRDSCTREGSTLTKAISTSGRQNIQVEYDVMAALNAPPQGSPSGTCAVLENSIEDKLVVYYSASGTNGPWNLAQTLSEGVELPTPWTRKLINLAGISAVNDNSNFALRFQWQFNSSVDTGRLDNIRLLAGAVTAPKPAIVLATLVIDRTVEVGRNLPADLFRVSNSGEGTLNFSLTSDAAWLILSPSSASSSGPDRTINLTYNTAALAVGHYRGAVQIISTNAVNSPQKVAVDLHVIPSACFWEPFNYYDGNLSSMGALNWSGSASNQVQTVDGALTIAGGAGTVSATHVVGCAGSNGVIGAEIKIRKGTGAGDFFWNIAFDDPMSNNLARWYGGSSYARGRVGNNITADMFLSGPNIWDDLYIKIDTRGNTSEFFFNGVSFGAIPHGTGPADTVGSIRIDRLDRFSAANDDIHFDSLNLAAVDLSPPQISIERLGGAILLSWPSIRMGATMESTPSLASPASWNPVTNSITMTNGWNTFLPNASNSASFFRLRRP